MRRSRRPRSESRARTTAIAMAAPRGPTASSGPRRGALRRPPSTAFGTCALSARSGRYRAPRTMGSASSGAALPVAAEADHLRHSVARSSVGSGGANGHTEDRVGGAGATTSSATGSIASVSSSPGDQDEPALVHPRMGDLQVGLIDGLLVVREDDVDGLGPSVRL
jgi:hypothetical protein